jgi:hypothetical protein
MCIIPQSQPKCGLVGHQGFEKLSLSSLVWGWGWRVSGFREVITPAPGSSSLSEVMSSSGGGLSCKAPLFLSLW